MTFLQSSEISYAKSQLKSLQTTSKPQPQTPHNKTTISTLHLQPHPEGGYFVETDRDPLQIPNPFLNTLIYPNATVKPSASDSNLDKSPSRTASTTIHYYLDPARPLGVFHRNKGRTIHTLHRGRGVYVLIHADQVDSTGYARVETFTVGPDIAAGERIQWIVEGGKFKSSFLLPDAHPESGEVGSQPATDGEAGLLISETVVPGFEFADHDFLDREGLRGLVSEEDYVELEWLLREERLADVEIKS